MEFGWDAIEVHSSWFICKMTPERPDGAFFPPGRSLIITVCVKSGARWSLKGSSDLRSFFFLSHSSARPSVRPCHSWESDEAGMAERSEVKAQPSESSRFYSEMREKNFQVREHWCETSASDSSSLACFQRWNGSSQRKPGLCFFRWEDSLRIFFFFLASSALSKSQKSPKERKELWGSDALWDCHSNDCTPEPTSGEVLPSVRALLFGQSGDAAVVEFFVVYRNDNNLTTEIKHSQTKTWNTGGDLLQNYLFLFLGG